ncbi:MAG TPA: FAD-dependent oxidoreductase, partial [Glycomyces sp.]
MTTLQHVSGPEADPTGPVRFTANVGRAEAREQLGSATFDLLVIGGGILGISTAWHAAQSGLRVALVDAGDFAGATSSASSKLLHGG